MQNMRLSIGTQGRTMLDISLSAILHDRRTIDVRFLQDNTAVAATSPEHELASVHAAPDNGAPGNNNRPPHQQVAPPPGGGPEQRDEPRGHLKITVAAEKADDDKDYLDKMRGWLMTVAALFVNMAFTAMLHPPDWLKKDWYVVPRRSSTLSQLSVNHLARGSLYLIFNASTFAVALALVLALLRRSSAKRTIKYTKQMTRIISVCVAITFAVGTSDSWAISGIVIGIMVLVASSIFTELIDMEPQHQPSSEEAVR